MVKNFIKKLGGIIYYNSFKKFKALGNRCLIYHAFGSKLKHDTYGISINIKRFEEHLKYITDKYAITVADDFSSNNLSVSISIDDGYKDTLDAINILVKYNIPFSLFITINTLNKKDYLTHDDIREISKIKNVMIGTHGLNHVKFGNISYKDQFNELKKSKIQLQQLIDKKVKCLSYPHGSYNQDTLDIMPQLKYEWAACSRKGFNDLSTHKFLLHRSEIVASDRVSDLELKIKGYYDYF